MDRSAIAEQTNQKVVLLRAPFGNPAGALPLLLASRMVKRRQRLACCLESSRSGIRAEFSAWHRSCVSGVRLASRATKASRQEPPNRSK